jgi:hypothetical protein
MNKNSFNKKDKALKDALRYGKSSMMDVPYIQIKKTSEFFMAFSKLIKTLT